MGNSTDTLYRKFQAKKKEQTKSIFIWIAITIIGALISYMVSSFIDSQAELHASIQDIHLKIERLVHPETSGILNPRLFEPSTNFGLTEEEKEFLRELKNLIQDNKRLNQKQLDRIEGIIEKIFVLEKSIEYFKAKLIDGKK